MSKSATSERNQPVHGGSVANVSIDTYIDLVNECARHRLDYPIANGSPFHARILISKLFEIAEKEVLIVTGALRAVTSAGVDIYGYSNVIKEARNFLTDPAAKLSIIFQSGKIDRGESKNPFLKSIIHDENRNGLVELIKPKVGLLDIEVPHFMVSDGCAFRLETGSDAKHDHEGVSAIANFGDTNTAAELRNYYETWVDILRTERFATTNTFVPKAAS